MIPNPMIKRIACFIRHAVLASAYPPPVALGGNQDMFIMHSICSTEIKAYTNMHGSTNQCFHILSDVILSRLMASLLVFLSVCDAKNTKLGHIQHGTSKHDSDAYQMYWSFAPRKVILSVTRAQRQTRL